MPRNGTFSGLQLDEELKSRDAEPWCGVQIIDLASGDIVEWIKLESVVTELFAVSAIPGVRWPMAAGFLNDEIHKNITIELPPGAGRIAEKPEKKPVKKKPAKKKPARKRASRKS